MTDETTPLRDYALQQHEVFALKREYEKLRETLLQGNGAIEHVSRLDFQPKALKTSLLSAFCCIEVMRDILIQKEIITEVEFYSNLNEAMKAEIHLMESYLSDQHSHPIKLGAEPK